MTEAIVVLDMTNDSIAPGARALEQRKKILPATAQFLAWGRKSGRPVVHICSARRKTDKWFLKSWEFVNQIWSQGQQPIPALFDAANDTIVHKRRYSAFFASDLDLTLREMDVDSLVLLGWSTSLAVLTTAVDAWQHGYPTTVLSDLTIAHAWGGHSVEENQQWSLDLIKAFAFSRIATSAELMG
jgi:nicotinamidase-related amidase